MVRSHVGVAVAHRHAYRIAPHGRRGHVAGGTIFGDRREELGVADVRRNVSYLDASLPPNERVKVALRVSFDAIAILALEDDLVVLLLRVRIVRSVQLSIVVLPLVVLMVVGMTARDARRLRPDTEPTSRYEAALRWTEVFRTVGILLGYHPRRSVLEALRYLPPHLASLGGRPLPLPGRLSHGLEGG